MALITYEYVLFALNPVSASPNKLLLIVVTSAPFRMIWYPVGLPLPAIQTRSTSVALFAAAESNVGAPSSVPPPPEFTVTVAWADVFPPAFEANKV
jgi:hypothetical protein